MLTGPGETQASDQPAQLLSIQFPAQTRNNGGSTDKKDRFIRKLFTLRSILSESRFYIKKVDAPHVPDQIIEPVPLKGVNLLLATCKGNSFFDKRDRAMIFFLLDTGARAQEVCDINLEDVELNSGKVIIREGKGRKPRYVSINKTTIKALRAYLRIRDDLQTEALFLSKTMERLTYDGLRQLIQRRSRLAGLKKISTLHDFRRQFALSMLNNGVDIFSLQRLMGHQDIAILRRYLAQTTDDICIAHAKGSPVENYSWD